MSLLYFVYASNILVAGWVGFTCLFYPKKAQKSVFNGTVAYSETIRLVGSLWSAIVVISVLGFMFPIQMSVILIFQWIYKTSWLIIVGLPASLTNKPYPLEMAIFFSIWSLSLPFIIPWNNLF